MLTRSLSSAAAPVLVIGRDARAVRGVEALLTGQPEFSCAVKIMTNGHAGVLEGVAAIPGAVVLSCPDLAGISADADAMLVLTELAQLPAARRPPIIICGELRSAESLRLALRCGVQEMLSSQPDNADLLAALRRVIRVEGSPHAAVTGSADGQIVSLLGAAGGVGASFLATNLAFLASQTDGQSALLLDLDLQFAPLTAYLGVKPDLGLSEAVNRVAALDSLALTGYVATHRSGLALMAGSSREQEDLRALASDRFRSLLVLATSRYSHVFVDAQRWLDPASTVAVLDSRHVVLVLEQSVGHVHNAVRLYRNLTRQLGVPADRITVVVNRHSRRSAISTADIERAMVCSNLLEIPSEYELARDSLDTAMPLSERDRRSTLGRALSDLASRLGMGDKAVDTGFFRRALPIFRKGDA
jgi:pilus assembly protein CpaE